MAREVRACCLLIAQRDARVILCTTDTEHASLSTHREGTSSAGLPGLEETMLHKQPNKTDRVSGFVCHGTPAFGQDSPGTAEAGVTAPVTFYLPREKAED